MNDFEEKLNEALRPARALRPFKVGRQALDQYREAATRFGHWLSQLIKIHPEMRSKIRELLNRLNQEIGKNILESGLGRPPQTHHEYEIVHDKIEDAYYGMLKSIPKDFYALRRKLQLIHQELIKNVYLPLGGIIHAGEKSFGDTFDFDLSDVRTERD